MKNLGQNNFRGRAQAVSGGQVLGIKKAPANSLDGGYRLDFISGYSAMNLEGDIDIN